MDLFLVSCASAVGLGLLVRHFPRGGGGPPDPSPIPNTLDPNAPDPDPYTRLQTQLAAIRTQVHRASQRLPLVLPLAFALGASTLAASASACGGDAFGPGSTAAEEHPDGGGGGGDSSSSGSSSGASGSSSGSSGSSGGAPDASEDAPQSHDAQPDAPMVDSGPCTCVSDLSGIGLADFWIAFTLNTTSMQGMALLNQRATCDSSKAYWDVFTGGNGAYGLANGAAIFLAIGDGTSNIDNNSTMVPIDNGLPHRVVISRTGGGSTLTLTVDGVGAPQQGVATNPLPAGLPPLQTGTDTACGYEPLAGSLTDLCISVACPLH